MEFKTYIETAAEKAGGIPALATIIRQDADVLRKARRGERPITIAACYLLAAYIDAPIGALVAANELVSEKNPEKRAVFLQFAQEIATAAKAKTTHAAKTFARAHSFP